MNKKSIDFKTFESTSTNVDAPKYYAEPQGLLRRTAAVQTWDKIGIGRSTVDGWGVFAVDHIEKDEIIEVAPLLLLPKVEVKGTSLMDYVFKIDDSNYALALGSASLYNHRNQPIATWKIDAERLTITFRAIRGIIPGEEIFVSYGKNYWNSRGIKPESGFETKIK